MKRRRTYEPIPPTGLKTQHRRIDFDRVSTILAESEFVASDEELCKKWAISDRTLRNYRAIARNNKELSAKFQAKREIIMNGEWKAKAEKYLDVALDSMDELAKEAKEQKNPKLLYELTGSVKVVGELLLTYSALLDEPVGDEN